MDNVDNNVALYHALVLFRNGMLPFIVEHLKEAYGNGWWTAGVQRTLGEKTVESLNKQYERRYKQKLASVKRPGQEVEQMLDIGHFHPIIMGNWNRCFVQVFSEPNKNKVDVWLSEVIEARNPVAHPEDQPLNDEDTTRALDTMTRLVEVVNLEVAQQIRTIRQQLEKPGSFSQDDSQTSPFWQDLKDGPHDYGKGLAKLQTVIIQKEGQGSENYLKLLGHGRQLATLLYQRRLQPGIQDGQLESRIEAVFRELDRLTDQHFRPQLKQFFDLCLTLTPTSNDYDKRLIDPFSQIKELEHYIADLKNKLSKARLKKAAQLQTQTSIPILEKEIGDIQETLFSKQKELTNLVEKASPPTWFSVQRKFESVDKSLFVEEQPITVTVEVTNQGREATLISYEEVLPSSFELIDGSLCFEAETASGEICKLTYRCFAKHVGKYRFETKMEYPGRVNQWDRIEETLIEIVSGTEPSLQVERYYRLRKDGLEILVNFTNNGDKIAQSIQYEEEVSISGQSSTLKLNWKDKIWGAETYVLEHFIETTDPSNLHFPDDTKIEYRDSHGNVKQLTLKPHIRRIEYKFPISSDLTVHTVGREYEISIMSTMVDYVWRLWRDQSISSSKRLLLIEGIEGTGKTRLVHELIKIAEEKGFAHYTEDAKDRSPMKRMLRRLLSLKPDEDNDQAIIQRLEEKLPGEDHSLRREILFRFISTIQSEFASDEQLNMLEAHTIVAIRVLCEKHPTLITFENIHWTPEGAEQKLLLRLFKNVLVNRESPILICATYRPGEGKQTIVGNLNELSPTTYELIEARVLNEENIRLLVDQIVDFPRFNDSLHHFVRNWSGNPLYIIELLRLLTHPDSSYLVRVKGEWHPSQNVNLTQVIPDRIDEVIRERVDLELPEVSDLARKLAAIGFELPSRLLESFVALEFPDWQRNKLYERLENLVKAGVIKENDGTEYEFEHQIKREILYHSLSGQTQLRLRQQVAEILLSNQVFSDPDEQLRQLARHIVKSPHGFKIKHLDELKKAADLEQGSRNFSRSLDFYSAVLEIVPTNSLEQVELLIKRSRVYQLQGAWLPASRDLKQAHSFITSANVLANTDSKKTNRIRIQVQKEQARVLLRQSQGSWDQANDLLYQARVRLEGNLRLRRFFLPDDYDFHRDLTEIYLSLAEVWLLKRNFKTCKTVCKRAERIAKKASKKWPDKPLLFDVYQVLGDLHFEQGDGIADYAQALRTYELALQYAQYSADRYQQERIWLKIAEINHIQGDLAKAQETYKQAIRVQEELGDTYGLALSYGGLGDLLVEQNEFEQGRYYCEQAYQYQKLISDLDRFWRTCLSLVKILLHDNNLPEATQYWLEARPLLFGARLFSGLKSKKQREIYEILERFVLFFRENHDDNQLCSCLKDKDAVAIYIIRDRDEETKTKLELGETYIKLRRWTEAIETLGDVLERTHSRETEAEALEYLGDVFAEYEPPQSWFDVANLPLTDEENLAESYYEKAIQLHLDIGATQRILRPYEKLLNRIVTDEEGLLQLPFTFLRILRHTSSLDIHQLLTEKSTGVLLRSHLYVEAGDILVYASRESAKSQHFQASLDYLKQAEEYYRRGKQEDIIWGLNMLIPSYFRLNEWSKVAQCFEELFEQNVARNDGDGFIEAFRAVGELRELIETEELEGFVALALSGQREIILSATQRSRLFLHIAKHYSYVADRLKEPEEKTESQDLALSFYERSQTIAENLAIVSTILNDTALIYKERKDYDKALQMLTRAIQIDEQARDYESASQVRSNRASLYVAIDEHDKALSDLQQAVPLLERATQRWDERLAHQDMHPLSPSEVISMRYTKRYLAATYGQYSSLLSFFGQRQKAMEVMQQSLHLYSEIGMLPTNILTVSSGSAGDV
jgi:tetratricopeptide (TPR) repeat protein